MKSYKFSAIVSACRIVTVVSLFCSGPVYAQTAANKTAELPGNAELRAARAYDAARANPLDLRAFLVRMPKGADLHYHLGGGIYAETLIRSAIEDGICVELASLSLTKPAIAARTAQPQPFCGDGKVPAAKAYSDQHLYDELIDAFSMRSFVPSAGVSARSLLRHVCQIWPGRAGRLCLWRDEPPSRRGMAGRNRQPRRLTERAVPGIDGNARL